VALVFFFVRIAAITLHTLVLQTKLVVTTMIVRETLGAFALAFHTNAFVETVAIAVAGAFVARRILVDALAVVGTITGPGDVAHTTVIVAQELRTIGATAITRKTLIVFTDFIVRTMIVAQTLCNLALAVHTDPLVQFKAIAVAGAFVTTRILKHSLPIIGSLAITCNVAHTIQIMAHELFAIRISTVAWKTLVAFANLVVIAMFVTHALHAFALAAVTDTLV